MLVQNTLEISVIIPARNYGKFLKEAIESVLNQTLPVYEIVVIDDGSEDNTKSIVEEYSEKTRYFHLDKKGVGAARNFGIRNSSGEYLAHLDADDVWIPEKLEIQMSEFLSDPGLEIAGGMMQSFFDPGMSYGKKEKIFCSETPLPGFTASVLLLKRGVFFKVGAYREDLGLGQDLDWFLRVREMGIKEKMVEKLLAYRRIHDNNSSMQKGKNKKERLRILKESINRRRGIKPAEEKCD